MFSRDAKDEIAGVRFERRCCANSFLRALLAFGRVTPEHAAHSVRITTGRASSARAILAAAHRIGADAHSDRNAVRREGSRWIVHATLAPHVTDITHRHVPLAVPARLCCRRAWLRAAFLACGSVSDPSHTRHLEFVCADERVARGLCELLASLGVDASLSRRRGHALVYVKHAESVAALLGHMGAAHAVLRLAGVRAINQTKNSIRRTVNSEAANAARAASTAARQRDAATRAIATLGLNNISPALREAAQLRIAHPSRTLRELAKAARPPITKAAMASRLRLLERLAQR